MAILMIRNESGEFQEVQAINGQKGANGKSAYQAAKEAGYNGTEAEFNDALASLSVIPTSEIEALF